MWRLFYCIFSRNFIIILFYLLSKLFFLFIMSKFSKFKQSINEDEYNMQEYKYKQFYIE